jgi:hypothetical protein
MAKIMALSGDEANTPSRARKYLYPSVEEQRLAMREEKALLEEQHEKIYNALGRPNKRNLKRFKGVEFTQKFYDAHALKRYFSIGEDLNNLGHRYAALDREFTRITSETYESMFLRAAKNMLTPEEFERVDRYTEYMLTELRRQVHPEPPEL